MYRPFPKLLNTIDRSAAAGMVHRRRFLRYSLVSPILSKKSPDLHDFHVTLSGSSGGLDPPLCEWTNFLGLIYDTRFIPKPLNMIAAL